MSIGSIYTISKHGFIFCAVALSLSGCALGPIGGAAVSLVSGTVTGVSDVTSNVADEVVDATKPDNNRESTE